MTALTPEAVGALVERLLEPDFHDPACPFREHCYCDAGAPHDRVQHPLAKQAAHALKELLSKDPAP